MHTASVFIKPRKVAVNEDLPKPDYSGSIGYSYDVLVTTGWDKGFAKFWKERGMGPTGLPLQKPKQRKPPRKVE